MNRFRIIFLLLILSMFCGSNDSLAQTLYYKIVWKGDSIGFLSADQDKTEERIHYVIESKASFWVLRRFNLNYFYESIVSDSVMTFAQTSYHLNKKLKSSSSVNKLASGYKILVDGEVTENNYQAISHNITSVYHSPPLFSTQIFSERFGVFCTWKRLSPTKFELTKPDGRTNIYEYKNGICDKVMVNNRFTTFSFERVDAPIESQ